MSQVNDILHHLNNGGSLTPIDALNQFGCFRLQARIYDIKCMGINVSSEWVEKGEKRFKSYFILPEDRVELG